jgi:hypothetical protein
MQFANTERLCRQAHAILNLMQLDVGTAVTFQIPHKLPPECIVCTVRAYTHEYLPAKVIFHTDSDASEAELNVIRSDAPHTLIAASPVDSEHRDMVRRILDATPHLWLQTDGGWWSKADVTLHSAPPLRNQCSTPGRVFMTGIVNASQHMLQHVVLRKQ